MLDFIIVIISLITLLSDSNPALKALRSLRALRGLRPLRVVRRYPGMKLVVNAIFRALPNIWNVALVSAFFFIIFGIVGVQNWKGALNQCNDPGIETHADCVGTFQITGSDCELLATPVLVDECRHRHNGSQFPREWESLPVNFNHIGNGILTVFEVTSGEMWPDIMYTVVDATPNKEDVPLKRDNNPAASLYFIAVIIICSFLMLNVFVGVVIDNFNKMKADADGSALMTEQQKKWVEHIQYAMKAKPIRMLPPPDHTWRRPIFRLVESRFFEWFIMSCIILNTVLMACRHAKQTTTWTMLIENGNLVFTAIFAIECALKLVGLNPYQYFKRGWNRFDFALVILSFAGMLGSIGGIAGIFRIFRVARIFRLVKSLRGLRILFNTLLLALPSVFNVGTILVLVHFIFACMGMNLFSAVKLQENLNVHANFQGFGISMLTLFRVSTGESYNAIMHDCRIQPPYCTQEAWVDADGIERPSNCGIFQLSPFFFCFFFLISNYVLLNLLVAIIIDSLVMVANMSGGVVTPEDIEEFQRGWADLDPDGDSMVPIDQVTDLILRINWPLGMNNAPGSRHLNENAKHKEAERMMMRLNIKNYDGEINFHETLVALLDTFRFTC